MLQTSTFGIPEIFAKRDLIRYLVKTHLKLTYSNKVLGFLWTLLDPLAMAAIYTLLVMFAFKQRDPRFPVLILTCLLSWKCFTVAVNSSVTAITNKNKIIQSIQFPKAIFPIATTWSAFTRYFASFLVLLPFLWIYHIEFTWNVLWLPVVVAVQVVFTLGFCILCSVIGVYLQDLENILSFGLKFWFYLSPAILDISLHVPKKYWIFFHINPFSSLFNSYKNVLIFGEPPVHYLIWTFLLGVVLLLVSLRIVAKLDHKIAKDV